jgi:predicted CoA-substrate-specific enzyme activase
VSLVAGIDVGSRVTKAVILDEDRRVRGRGRARTRPDFAGVARSALEEAAREAGLDTREIDYLATTGLGRYNVPFRDLQITEITCVARGAAFVFPGTRCVLDVGAQSSRAIRVLPPGRVKEFKSNDKCAAGGGGFLERAARYLEVPLEELGEISLRADRPQPISSVCAVLAESEIINHVSAGQSVENIVRGIHDALASRAMTLLARVGLEAELTLVGGVALQAGMVKALEAVAGMSVNVPAEPEMAGALGAALLGQCRLRVMKNAGMQSGPIEGGVEGLLHHLSEQ